MFGIKADGTICKPCLTGWIFIAIGVTIGVVTWFRKRGAV